MEPKQSIAPELVKEFVGNAHGDLTRVRELLEQEPGLLNAAWIGAAAIGRPRLAPPGAYGPAGYRAVPARAGGAPRSVRGRHARQAGGREGDDRDRSSLKDALGPHGIPLVAHAAAGGEEASAVIAFLQ